MTPDNRPSFLTLARERDKTASGIKTSIRAMGNTIYTEAAKQHDRKLSPVNWDRWSAGELIPQEPIKLSDLTKNFPALFQALIEPVGDVQRKRDQIDNDTSISSIGYWNNPDANYVALIVRLTGNTVNPQSHRQITIEGGGNLARTWRPGFYDEDKTPYQQSAEEMETLKRSVIQAWMLTEEIIEDGRFTATFDSQREKIR